jgi:Family of unknown function (DUF5941)
MTVALLLAAAPDRLSAMAHPYQHPWERSAVGAPWLDFMGDRLMSAGVRQVDVAMCADAADGLRAVAVTVRDLGEPVLVCTSARALATPGADLAALVGKTGTAALATDGALLVARADLPAVAAAAEALAARFAAGDRPGRGRRLSIRRINRRTRVTGELDSAVDSLIACLSGNGIRVTSLDAKGPGTGTGQAPGRPGPPAGPAEPGLVASFAVSPLARGLARGAVARGLAPEAFTTAAFALSVCAAAWFAAGSRSSLIIGSVLLCVALPVRQARGWLPVRSGAAAAFSGWLSAVSGAAAEYAVYAGLAIGWSAARPRHAWAYATTAMILLAVRQMTDGCYAAVAGPRPDPAGQGHRLLRLAGQSIAFPVGERTLLIAVAAPIGGPRLVLTVLIAWGVIALGYVLAERIVASRVLIGGGRPGGGLVAGAITAIRDDGPLATRVGRVVQGQLPPLLPAIAGVTVTAMLAALGLRNLPGLLLLAPAVAMLLAALGADNPHTGRFDWLVPPLLQAGQYVYLAAAGAGPGVPAPAVFALIAVIALHHTDVLHRERRGIPPSPGVFAAGLGWEGRMLVVGIGGMLGIETFVYIALAVYLWGLFGWDSVTSWLTVTGRASR